MFTEKSFTSDRTKLEVKTSASRYIFNFYKNNFITKIHFVQVEYSKEEHTKCTKDFPLTLHFAKPFEMTTQFYTTLFESTNKGFVDEPLIVMPHLTCTSPWPINIIDATIELVRLYIIVFCFKK